MIRRILLIATFIPSLLFSQVYEVQDKIYGGLHEIKGSFVFKDSTVTDTYSGTLVNKNYVDNKKITSRQDSLSFNKIAKIDFQEYTIFADTANHTLTVYLGESEISPQLFLEEYVISINKTGTTITNGTPVYQDSCAVCTFGQFKRAQANDVNKASSVVGVATHDIENETIGFATKYGNLTLPSHGFTPGLSVFVSDTNEGMTQTRPTSPNYPVYLGKVLNDSIIQIDVNPFTDTDTEVNLEGILNGIVIYKPAVRDTAIGNTLYYETYNETHPTTNLPYMFGSTVYLLNTTTNTGTNGYARVALNYGTESSPQKNYIYIDHNGGSPQLAVSTTSFPDEGLRIAECGVFDSANHADYGFEHFQRWNNAVNGTNADGWINKSARNARLRGTTWYSGVTPTVTIVVDGAGLDSLNFYTSSGVVPQFNFQNFDAQTEKEYYWYNCPSGGKWITDLNQIDSTANGTSLRSNNSRYDISIFGVQNSNNISDYLVVAVSSETYTSDDGAITDAGGYSINGVPDNLRFTGFKIARVPLRYNTTSGGTITNLLGDGNYQDRRGDPLGLSGGGSGSAGGQEYPVSDVTWSVNDNSDPTKIMQFEASNITTGTTRTLTIPDKNDTIATLSDMPDSTWSTISVTDTILVGDGNNYIDQFFANGLRIDSKLQPYSFEFNLLAPSLYVNGTGDGLTLNFNEPSLISPNIIPRAFDSNTGYGADGNDKLALVAGGQSTLTSEYNSTALKSITTINDSLEVNGAVNTDRLTADSIYLDQWYSSLSGGGGEVDTAGTPVANQVAYFTAASKIGGSSNFTWNDTALSLKIGTNNLFIGENTGGNYLGTTNNLAIGSNAGSYISTECCNVYLGVDAGASGTSGNNNVIIGSQAGEDIGDNENVVIGSRAGYNMGSGGSNVYLGHQAGYNAIGGDLNVFIGHQAGYNETGSSKLYVDNSNTSTPLIHGDFAADTLRFNGDVKITGSLKGQTNTEAFATTKTIDFDSQHSVEYTVTGTTTITISNVPDGFEPDLAVIMDATGGYTVTISGATQAANTNNIDNTANKINLVQFKKIAGTVYWFNQIVN